MKKVLFLIFVLIVAISGYVYHKEHERSQVITEVSPLLKDGTLRLLKVVELESKRDVLHLTVAEAFSRLDSYPNEIENIKTRIRSNFNSDAAPITTPVLQYLEDCQEVMRIMSMKYRSTMDAAEKMKFAKNLIDKSRTDGTFGEKEAVALNVSQFSAALNALQNQMTYTKDLHVRLKQLMNSREQLLVYFSDDLLIPKDRLDLLMQTNDQELKAIPSSGH